MVADCNEDQDMPALELVPEREETFVEFMDNNSMEHTILENREINPKELLLHTRPLAPLQQAAARSVPSNLRTQQPTRNSTRPTQVRQNKNSCRI